MLTLASVGRNSRERTKFDVYVNSLMMVFYDRNMLWKRCIEIYKEL
jgi:hypothetical protein